VPDQNGSASSSVAVLPVTPAAGPLESFSTSSQESPKKSKASSSSFAGNPSPFLVVVPRSLPAASPKKSSPNVPKASSIAVVAFEDCLRNDNFETMASVGDVPPHAAMSSSRPSGAGASGRAPSLAPAAGEGDGETSRRLLFLIVVRHIDG
jgi:hypothetical protein